MNIFKSKKITLLRRISNLESKLSCFFTKLICFKSLIATTLTFVLVMTCVGLPLTAKARRGATVEVILIDRHRVNGELLAVKGHDLIIHDKSRDQGFTVNIEQVSRIWLKKKSRFISGLALGLVTGAGIGLIMDAANTTSEWRGYGVMLMPILTAPIGGLVGAIHGLSEKLPIKGEEPAYIEECLQYLQQHAREQNLEKAVEPN